MRCRCAVWRGVAPAAWRLAGAALGVLGEGAALGVGLRPPPGALVVRGSTGAGRRPVWVCVHVVWGVRSRGGWGPPYLVLQCECHVFHVNVWCCCESMSWSFAEFYCAKWLSTTLCRFHRWTLRSVEQCTIRGASAAPKGPKFMLRLTTVCVKDEEFSPEKKTPIHIHTRVTGEPRA